MTIGQLPLNILFIVPYAPNPIRTRPYNLIRALARRGHKLTVATLWEDNDERLFLESLSDADIRVFSAPLSAVRKARNLLGALPSRTPLQANYCWQPQLLSQINIQLPSSNFQPDIIHVEHLRGARYGLAVSELPLTGPFIWDSVDCISYLFEQASRHSQSFFGKWVTRFELGRTRRYEGWLISQFDRVLVTSGIDKTAIEELASDQRGDSAQTTERANLLTGQPANVSVLPNGVDLNYFKPNGDIYRDPATLVVSGKMSYHANITMTLNLVNEIMPLVWKQRPDVRVLIVGKDPGREIKALDAHPAIRVTGTVEDIRPYLWSSTLAVAPVTYGAGIQNKVLEAMACAAPVVASTQAGSALDVVPDRDLILAEGTRAFAGAILELLEDSQHRRELGTAGRRYVEVHHHWDQIAAQLEVIYREVIQCKQERDA